MVLERAREFYALPPMEATDHVGAGLIKRMPQRM
jgi:hypothetical protein